MPQVPVYNPGQVRQEGVPGVRRNTDAPIEAFGGGQSKVTDAAQGVLGQVEKLAMREQEKMDDLRVQDAYAQAVKRKNDRFWDPKVGAVTRRGRDAAGVIDEFTPIFEKDLADIEEGLGNSAQKAQFRNIRSRLASDFNDNLIKHSYGEGEKFADSTYKAVIENTINDAAMNYSQAGKIEGAVNIIAGQTIEYANRKGFDGELNKVELQGNVSKMHRSIIDQMISLNRDVEAKAHLDKYKDSIVGDDRDHVNNAVKTAYSLEESQRQTEALILKNKGDFSKARKEAKATLSGDIEERTLRLIEHEESYQTQARARAEDNNYRGTYNKAKSTGKLPNALEMSRLSPPHQREVEELISGKQYTTKWSVYQDLVRLASNPSTRSGFLQKQIFTEHRKDLADSEMEKLIDWQAKIQMGDDKVVKQLDGIQSTNSIIDNVVEGVLKIDKNTKDDTERGRVSKFWAAVNKEVVSQQNAAGKEITQEEVREIAERLATTEVIEKRFLGIDSLWPDEERPAVFERTIDEVPQGARDLIKKSLQKRGLVPTDSAVIHYWLKGQKKSGR